MNKLYIIGPASKDSGGIAQYITEHVKQLDDTEFSVHDIAPKDGTGLIWLAVTVICAIRDAVRYAGQSPPDVAHVHTSHSLSFLRASFYVLFTRYVWRRPVLLHVHGSSFHKFVNTESRLLAWYQTGVFAATCRVIVLSSYWGDVLSSRVPPDKIETIPNAIDPSDYNSNWGSPVAHVVFISNLIERKGVRELVEAIRRINKSSNKEYRVTIAGKGPLSPNVEELAAEIDYVDYRGFVSEKEKQSILESGSIYVLPSYAEGLPIAILEGMAGGNAIVSTKVGSIPEVVNEDTGITVEPRNIDQLESAIRVLINNPERTAEMGRRGRKLAEERYSWGYVAGRLRNLYRDCIDKSCSG
jgi:glycosyltransferase involved in cell wall biosynthesis